MGLVLGAGCGGPTDPADPVVAPLGSEAGSAARSRAAAILKAAIETLESRASASAGIRQQVDVFDRQLVGSGEYFQQRAGTEQLIRLELRILVGDRPSSLIQVAAPPTPKGRYLWTYRKLPEKETLSRIDLSRVAEALKKAPPLPTAGSDGVLTGVGGIPRLLRGLQASFDFHSAEQGRFGGLAVWRLQGQWKPERLAEILPDQKEAIEAGEPPDLSALPGHLPDRVVLMLGEEDLFPRRIEYRRGIAGRTGRQGESRSLVTMELFDVKLNEPIARTRFIYNPGKAKYSDKTDSFLSALRAAR